ncbi:Os01g0839801 [Oryza sativa Japonica Group]|uniref:Os01g0839801 protein n=1 Tax=Oryza sativa subsp. japonica TaxID=39947 RepID=A0A0N7KE14_ORYSJ|nr:Os01g0839801 [Oryza sativa Japonica Group]
MVNFPQYCRFLQSISCDFLTRRLTFFLKSSLFSLHSLAASIFAGDSSFGPESIEMMLRTMLSTVCTGVQRSLASS